jgi:hypothetical protein
MLREFLYVDVNRVRSLLAQLDRGVVESIVDRWTGDKSADFGATLFGIHGGVTLQRGETREESRSVQDLLFTVFEEAVDSEGLVRELTGEAWEEPASWDESRVHDRLREGEIVRVFAPILVADPQFVLARFDRYVALNDALAEMTAAQLKGKLAALKEATDAALQEALEEKRSAGMNRDQLRNEEKRLKAETRRNLHDAEEAVRESVHPRTPEEVSAVISFINRFVSSDAISVRFLMCGEARPELAFIGSLLGRDEYIQREREALFSRYGSLLRGWTALLQVAAVPTREARDAALTRDFSTMDVLSQDGAINRAAMERGAMQLTEHMEALGVSEGPLWPTISVVPLGIYRVVPGSESGTGEIEASQQLNEPQAVEALQAPG